MLASHATPASAPAHPLSVSPKPNSTGSQPHGFAYSRLIPAESFSFLGSPLNIGVWPMRQLHLGCCNHAVRPLLRTSQAPTRSLHENGQPDQENNEFGLTARARFGENRFQLHAGGADADIMLFSDILDRLPTGEPHCQPSFRFRQTKDLLQ